MSAQHTQVRIRVQHPHAGERGWELAYEPGLEQVCQDVTEANARRIAACWNACEGIPTELLEAAPYKDSASFMAFVKMEAQRDQLLDALRGLVSVYGEDSAEAEVVAARAAIAKATGVES